MKKIFLGTLTLMLAFGLVFATGADAFGPPGHGGVPPGQAGEIDDESELPPGLRDKGTPPGLEDKGGIPPGLQGRDVLPPGIQMRFQEALSEMERKGQEEIAEIVISGESAVALPVDEEPVTAKYAAIALDDEGEELKEVNADWNLADDFAGVSIDDKGVLEVTDEAEAGVVTLEATYTKEIEGEIETLTAKFDVELYVSEIAGVEIEGSKYVAISGDEEDALNLEYSAVVLDQQDKAVEGEEVSWSVTSEDFENLEIDAEGNITIDELVEGQFTVKVVLDSDESIENELQVTLYIPEAASVEVVAGAASLALPEEGQEVTEEYAAVVLDQYDFEIEGEIALWFLADAYDGVSISYEGILTVEDSAEPGVIELLVVYEIDENGDDDVFTSYEVELLEEE